MVTDEIHAAFLGEYTEYKTFFHGHSYTGNCLACAAACACLDIFETDRVLEASQPKIELLKERLSEEISNLSHVGDVRQCGFMIGIELVEDRSLRKSYAPEKRMGAQVTQHVRNYGSDFEASWRCGSADAPSVYHVRRNCEHGFNYCSKYS